MCGNSLGYVVVSFNQASGQPGLDTGADLHASLEDAVNARDWERAETARIGRRERHVIAEVVEMDEDEIAPQIEREAARWAALVAKSRG
jgi:hypothetical protein